MPAPELIHDLIARFDRNRESYRSGLYKESQLRQEFINPFFKALGWDVDNVQGYAEAYKDVVHEDAIKVGGATKAPDYSFRIGGTRKFFVEAKKPSVDIAGEVAPAYQLRRYAWSAKLPLSILTDFEEFAVYDTRVRPAPTDKASAARVLYLTCADYSARWDELAAIFSRDAILKGSFDRYAESTRGKKGTTEVNDAFLAEIESWRDELARHLALRNPNLTQRQLNYAVQATIDRIIFLRIAEDRGIEPYGRLMALLNGDRAYARLFELFQRADERYNSGLFHFTPERDRPAPPDTLTRSLAVDDKPLKDILRRLYYPESPYEFAVIPADILGQVYEQFLGKVIRLTAGHHAVVEEKPEVRKAGGVYYTPTYIVDYIVRHTLGPLLGEPLQSSSSSSSSNSGPNPSGTGVGAGPSACPPRIPGETPRQGGHGDPPLPSGNVAQPPLRQGSGQASAVTVGSPAFTRSSERTPEERPPEGGTTNTPDPVGAGPCACPPRIPGETPRQGGHGDPPLQQRPTGGPVLTPRQVSKLRILDPACGSGSFLLGAFQYLLDWHLRYYSAHDPEKWATSRHPAIFQTGPNRQSEIENRQSGWRLTTAERKRILLNNLYGVDIDPQAVEVTKLSLLLKVLEGESGETLQRQYELFHERALPDLSTNIKCGNSLIGPEFYHGRQIALFGEEERYRINVFDWQAEFPTIMQDGGFDAVIGNPPYVRQEGLSEFKAYMKARYKAYHSAADLYVYFIERGLSLLRPGGLLGIVVSSSLLRATYATALRRWIGETAGILQFVDFGGLRVFEKAQDVYVCIPVIGKVAQPERVGVCKMRSLDNVDIDCCAEEHGYRIPLAQLTPEAWSLDSSAKSSVWEKIKSLGTELASVVGRRIYCGIKTGFNEAFEISADMARSISDASPQCARLIKPFLGGQDIRRYTVRDSGRFLVVIPCGWTRACVAEAIGRASKLGERDAWNWLKANYPPVAGHLEPFMQAAKARQDQGEFWWELRSCDFYHELDGPKIIYPDIAKFPRFYLDTSGAYIGNTAYCLATDDKYLLGVLNSRLSWFAVSCVSIPFGTRAGEFRYRLIYQYMEKLPIRVVDPGDKDNAARRTRVIELVDQMLALQQQVAKPQTGHDAVALQRQLDLTDREIDQLVYKLYGLTEEEIGIVEGARER